MTRKPLRNAKRAARLLPGQWVCRTDPRIDEHGTHWVDHYRRQVQAVDGDKLRLSGIERATCREGEEPIQWERCGGLLGGPSTTTVERLESSGYQKRGTHWA